MKKGLVWMLALFLAVAAAGCGNQGLRGAGAEGGEDGTGQKDIAITLWTYPVGNWGESAAVANLLSRFHEAYPNIHVSVNYLQYSDGDSMIDDAIAKGQLPDLVFEGPERLVGV